MQTALSYAGCCAASTPKGKLKGREPGHCSTWEQLGGWGIPDVTIDNCGWIRAWEGKLPLHISACFFSISFHAAFSLTITRPAPSAQSSTMCAACLHAGGTINLSHEEYTHAWRQQKQRKDERKRLEKPPVKEALQALSHVVSVTSGMVVFVVSVKRPVTGCQCSFSRFFARRRAETWKPCRPQWMVSPDLNHA